MMEFFKNSQCMEYIRKYNAAFSFISFNASQDQNISKGHNYTLRIQRQIYNRIGPLVPNPNTNEICAQVYFKGEDEIQLRQKYSSNLNAFVILQIQAMLTECENPFIQQFKKASVLAKGTIA